MIHERAVVSEDAEIGDNVEIGPFAVVEDNVRIMEGTRIGANAYIGWGTTIGRGCDIFNGASVGTIPQDLKFNGEETTLTIGDNNVIREFCTLNRGTKAAGETKIGSGCTLLAYCHIAHDCILGDNIVISNALAMAGHVQVGSNVTIGGNVSIHQFCRVGDNSFIGARSGVFKDVIPYALLGSQRDAEVRVAGINKVGLERLGFSSERRSMIKKAYRTLFREGLAVSEAVDLLLKEYKDNRDIKLLCDFISSSERGIYRMKS